MTASLADEIRLKLVDLAQPEIAPAMSAYMKAAENGTLPCLGIRRPTVRGAVRVIAKGRAEDELLDAASSLWDVAEFREQRYAAQDLIALPWARGRIELLEVHEHHVVSGRWWDFVDETAHRISDLVEARPDEMADVLRQWAHDDDMWLRRVAIIGQLGRRDRADLALLTEVIEPNLDDREFFIRKAIGWSLREVARWNPSWAQSFVDGHELSPLSRREALRHLGQ